MNFGIAIWNVVTIFIGIEQQIRRIENPQASTSLNKRCRNIQPIDECLVFVVDPVTIGVFVDGDLVFSLHAMRRRIGYLVVNGSPPLILAKQRQTSRFGVLQILHHPQTTPLVKIHEQRL